MLSTNDEVIKKESTSLSNHSTDTFSFLKTNSSDILTLKHLAFNDPMHKQLHDSFKPTADLEKPESSYSLFNKNFSTFMKYTDSNLDINMVVSDSSATKSKDCETDDTKMVNNTKETRLNDMLAATSLTKSTATKDGEHEMDQQELLSKSLDLTTPLERQNNCLNQQFTQSNYGTPTIMNVKLNGFLADPNEIKESHHTKPAKDQEVFNKKKLFCSNSSSNSSNCSNFSSSSSSSSRTGSNETTKLASSQTQVPRHLHQTPFSSNCNEKTTGTPKSSSSSSSSSTSSTSSTQSHILKATPFNIENELIKFTKHLKLNNRTYSDKYKLGNHIRNGGFSEIYEGCSINDKKENVIIKVIPKKKTKNWLMVHNKKYPAEVLLHKMCTNIDGVVDMIEFFEQENDWIIIMPKVENCMDLFDFLESKQRGRLSETEACHFFTQLIKINIELLNHGVVHRDIKSENILVDLDTMKLILIDFGASAICRNKTGHSGIQQHHYTDFHGTRQYKPPEYISHKKYTALASTIWTLGILLFDMCNGQLPFETEQEILEYNLQMKAPVSDEYKLLLHECLKLDPAKRPTLTQLLESSWCVNNVKETFTKDINL